MDELAVLRYLAVGWMLVAAGTFVLLWFISAPYGRHSRPGWGPALPAWLGWMAMETASPLALSLWFFIGNPRPAPAALVLWGLWMLHYLNRAWIYPLRIHGRRRPMAVSVVTMAVFFNATNGYLNGRALNLLGARYGLPWLLDPRFLAGLIVFVLGWAINVRSDAILRALRPAGDGQGYRIPRGGLFERVSSANYFGEIVEWTGWALMSWSLAGLSFAVWTAANLAPRARTHHRWYRRQFPDYPRERRALIPWLF